MTAPLRFAFALHLHQPWGNFDSVFEQHLEDVYRPLLRHAMAGELWPIAWHVSGPLLDWLEQHAPAFLDEIGEHASAGRLELLAAGYDEPILAVLPRDDRREQVTQHRARLKSRFGVEATGLWLTERVWEPGLPEDLAQAGVRFVLVDDRHFRVAGFSADQLHAHFTTEAGGYRVAVFPIDEKLRYLVPFRPPSELAEYFRSLRSARHGLAVLGDDGEKFGGWPGTAKWLYQEGWFESFLGTMRELRDRDEVRLTRLDAALTETAPGGLAYLPSASYREMEGWALPVEPARALLRLERDWGHARIEGIEGGLLRGSHWRNFLVKYPESNRMHKVMEALSLECRDRGDPSAIRRWIGRAQCNDAYWHGVFGGLYLPFLRHEVWQNLATAEAALRTGLPLIVSNVDVDADGQPELWIRSESASLLIAPARGGMIDMWLDLARRENLLDVLARHREAYHESLEPATLSDDIETEDGNGGAPSIHDLEGHLNETPPVDLEPRGLLADRVIAHDATLDDFIEGTVPVLKSWVRAPFDAEWRRADDAVVVEMRDPDLTKSVEWNHGVVRCSWRWRPDAYPALAWFSSEFSSAVPLAIDAPDAARWDYPIETVAKSEKGFDRVVQGTAVVFRWPIAAGTATVTISVPMA
ncbi:MAG: alpha-amylase/4-alpha-glucanotransferase domain-containing protein [Gemmatimonadales bacterium]